MWKFIYFLKSSFKINFFQSWCLFLVCPKCFSRGDFISHPCHRSLDQRQCITTISWISIYNLWLIANWLHWGLHRLGIGEHSFSKWIFSCLCPSNGVPPVPMRWDPQFGSASGMLYDCKPVVAFLRGQRSFQLASGIFGEETPSVVFNFVFGHFIESCGRERQRR